MKKVQISLIIFKRRRNHLLNGGGVSDDFFAGLAEWGGGGRGGPDLGVVLLVLAYVLNVHVVHELLWWWGF